MTRVEIAMRGLSLGRPIVAEEPLLGLGCHLKCCSVSKPKRFDMKSWISLGMPRSVREIYAHNIMILLPSPSESNRALPLDDAEVSQSFTKVVELGFAKIFY